ncbi:polyprenyl synthetase family protein [Rossellomorea sp. BNER]|uniref:polyprenyl synthetase family protein n=1 Tax=Rossellomorea sp. BNER TaxID=2962031 RepID=UPI003AF254FE|nr:polyprenyl synthetase family protein [Rossellomorea sp. BNER]
MNEYKLLVEKELSRYIQRLEAPSIIREAMTYSLQAGGKRIRPVLLFATIQAFNKNPKKGLPVACALEMIHTYSLIHDDLPSMDDDDLRRGKATNHKVFGEAFAILAGDALLTNSFQIIAEMEELPPTVSLKLLSELSKAAGPEGMVGGQVADIEGENKQLTVENLEYIHIHKTGKLLAFSVIAGAIIAEASQEEIEYLKGFAYHIGLAFQIQDDILDIEGSQEKIGKPIGSDEAKFKSTYPALLTLEGAKEKLHYHLSKGTEVLEKLNLHSDYLQQIAYLIANRDH